MHRVLNAGCTPTAGCILYQMVYGRPPFNKYTHQLEKMNAICNKKIPIDFPKAGLGGAA
ncbi:hypothetical protein T484DRAFT_1864213, partial [Baffinella frigidus]